MVDPQRSALMKRVRQKDTAPEMTVRKVLTDMGARFRTNVKDLPGSPDIANKSRKKAIFVHGCFWHGHQNCSKHTLPKNNQDFWKEKFKANIERDNRKIQGLKALGFDVIVVWQCDLRDHSALETSLRRFWFSDDSAV